jgi:hypothetical protein
MVRKTDSKVICRHMNVTWSAVLRAKLLILLGGAEGSRTPDL